MQNNEIVYLYLDDIIPNRFQPREIFDDEALKELAISIKEHGVIQPIIVRQVNNKYEIIAGERRYKAATMAGLTKIPAIVKDLDDKESSKVALIENLQRKDLTPIEEARTYQKILDLDNMTQEALAQTMGKTQSAVSNKLRLLALPDEVQDALLKEQISERHARSLLNVPNKNDQIRLLEKVISSRMTVKELDKEIKMLTDQGNSGQEDITKVPSNFNLFNEKKDDIAPPTYMSSFNSSANPNPNPLELPTPITTIPTSSELKEENNSMNNPTSIPNLNPTMVDINQIKENALDINKPEKPVADISELMKVTSKPEPTQDFKFIPGSIPNAKPLEEPNQENSSISSSVFGFGNVASSTNNSNLPQEAPNSQMAPSFDPFPSFMNSSLSTSSDNAALPSINPIPSLDNPSNNQNPTPMSNLNVADNPLNLGANSFLNQFGLNPAISNGTKNVQDAVSDIKKTIHMVEEKGFTVKVEESDGMDKYQIIINIDKK